MSDFLLLELDEQAARVHVFDREHKLIAVIENAHSVTRYEGWLSISHTAHERDAVTYIPADRFSRLLVLYDLLEERD